MSLDVRLRFIVSETITFRGRDAISEVQGIGGRLNVSKTRINFSISLPPPNGGGEILPVSNVNLVSYSETISVSKMSALIARGARVSRNDDVLFVVLFRHPIVLESKRCSKVSTKNVHTLYSWPFVKCRLKYIPFILNSFYYYYYYH